MEVGWRGRGAEKEAALSHSCSWPSSGPALAAGGSERQPGLLIPRKALLNSEGLQCVHFGRGKLLDLCEHLGSFEPQPLLCLKYRCRSTCCGIAS